MAMIRGPIFWAKILGEPQPGYDKRKREWSFDLGLTKETIKALTDLGVEEYIKPAEKNGKKHASGGQYIKFSRQEKKADGSDGVPLRVVGPDGKDWPEDKRIANGSIVNVKFAVNEKMSGGLKPSLVAVQVWEYIPYEGEDSFPTREADGEEDWG